MEWTGENFCEIKWKNFSAKCWEKLTVKNSGFYSLISSRLRSCFTLHFLHSLHSDGSQSDDGNTKQKRFAADPPTTKHLLSHRFGQSSFYSGLDNLFHVRK